MVGRRCFVKGVAVSAVTCLGCGGGGSVTGPLAPPAPSARVFRIALMAVGETVSIQNGEEAIAVTRLSASSVVAVSRTCTHMGCTVLLPGPEGFLDCPCHGSRFTVSGAVVNGPALRPLPSYTARIDGSEVTVSVN